MLGRVTGLVLGASRRQGTSNQGNAYDLTTVNVLVAGKDVTPVTFSTTGDLPDGGLAPRVSAGELVDWLVDFDVYRNEPSARLQADAFPDDAEALAALTAAAG